MGGEELRQDPRFRIALRAHLGLPSGTVSTTTVGVSRAGMSVKLPTLSAVEDEVPVTLELPSGTSIDGRARCKTHLPGSVCGMQLSFAGDALAHWNAFLDEEESTGSIWRMIGRVARAPDDALAPRGVRETQDTVDYRFHTVGENGEAYRVAFERHPSDSPEDCDLATTLPGFREQARRLVSRVLRQPITIRFEDSGKIIQARVAELSRGGFAFVQGDESTPTGLVALGVGELVLVSRSGQTVFPHFTDEDLERIACDTFRRDLPKPAFTKGVMRVVDAEVPRTDRPAPVTLPPLPASKMPSKFTKGYDAVRFAQAASDDVQVRRYGDRDIYFHPSVWARVKDSGVELIGPTIHDGNRVCVLALVGPGAPKVIRLDEHSEVALLKPPKKSDDPTSEIKLK
jgi:hypothetical protein